MQASNNECDQEYQSLELVQENVNEEDYSTDDKGGVHEVRGTGNNS